MKTLSCKIASIDFLNYNTRQVMLQIPDGEQLEFYAGQYLEICLPEKKHPFSIASAPGPGKYIELHIRPTPDSADSEEIENLLDTATSVTIEAPKGDCFLIDPPNNPLILIAASTGISQMKSILEHLLSRGLNHPAYLYWGVVSEADIYMAAQFKTWEDKHPDFRFIPVVSEPTTSPNWTGRTGLVGVEALADFPDPENITVFVSGGPGMVYATLDAFVEKGMPADNMHADVFSYAPR